MKYLKGVCDVCRLIDKDFTKKQVLRCDLCSSYICKDCQNNYLRRGKAALIKLMSNE